MSDSREIDSIVATLELCAERMGDIVPEVYERFLAKHAGARELMAHSDQHMRGRMFEAVLELLMTDQHLESGGYLEWELDNHIDAYAATASMYRAFFDAVLEVVREGVGDDWNDDHEAAWNGRFEKIMTKVDSHGGA